MTTVLTFTSRANPFTIFHIFIFMNMNVSFNLTILTNCPMCFLVIKDLHIVRLFYHMHTTITTFYWSTSFFLLRLMSFNFSYYMTTVLFAFCNTYSIFIFTDNIVVTGNKYFFTFFTKLFANLLIYFLPD